MTDLTAAPRPVPTTEDRMRDARTDHTFATYLDATERNQLDARAATAEQERDEALDELRDSRADRKHKSDLLLATARALDMLPGDLVDDTPAVAGRLRAERDEALDARNVLRQQLDTARAELGAAQELLAVVDDLAEQLDRARARYATRPEVTPVEPDKGTDELDDLRSPLAAERDQLVETIGRLVSLPPEQIAQMHKVGYSGGLGSAPPRAQDDRRRHALVFNALSRTLLDIGPFVPLSVRERCAEAVLTALDADRAELEG